uniref:Serpentine receptor class gamma n=1 Tax=Parastrongyloides trichosuri TaxID=131310 RepID=A0A0N4Z575_PARTI
MERGIFERDNKETLFTSLWKGHRERLISSYLALFLAYINHFACIVCLFMAKKSNETYLCALRVFIVFCCFSTVCYSISYPLLIFGLEMGFKEKAFFDGFIVNTKVYMTTKNMVSIVLYPLVTLAPFLISAPYLMRIYRKLRVESEENLIRAYGIK